MADCTASRTGYISTFAQRSKFVGLRREIHATKSAFLEKNRKSLNNVKRDTADRVI